MLSEQTGSARFGRPELLTTEQKLAVAGRTACITLFGGASAVTIDPVSPHPATTLTARDISGGDEIVNETSFAVGESELEHTLKTSLFNGHGLSFRWGHKSYGEFLAAYHLKASNVARGQIKQLLTSAGRVAPALRGVAGWLTSRDAQLFDDILDLDAELLLFADLSTATSAQKSRLVEWLIDRATAGDPRINGWDLFSTYKKLTQPKLGAQLLDVLMNSASISGRYCAIQIADACAELVVQTVLADLALNGGENIGLRIAAANFVAHHGDSGTRARFTTLARQTSADEDGDRLQVQALKAVWPEQCSWKDLKDILGKVAPQTTSALGRFIAFDVCQKLPLADLPDALTWAAQENFPPHGLSAWANAVDRFLLQVPVDDKTIQAAAVEVLTRRLTKHFKLFADSHGFAGEERDKWPKDKRRALFAGLITRLQAEEDLLAVALHRAHSLLDQNDIDFAIEHWSKAATPERNSWIRVLGSLIDWRSSSETAAMQLRLGALTPLWNGLEPWREHARLDLEARHATRSKEEAEKLKTKGARVKLILGLLEQSRSDSSHFQELVYTMAFPLDQNMAAPAHNDLRALPGWAALSAADQQRFLAAGKLFLESRRIYVLKSLQGLHSLTFNVLFSYLILRDLAVFDRAYLESQPKRFWKHWSLTIVLCNADRRDDEIATGDRALIDVCNFFGQTYLQAAFSVFIKRGHRHEIRRAFERTYSDQVSKTLIRAVRRNVRHPRLPAPVYGAGMEHLLRVEDAAVRISLSIDPSDVDHASSPVSPRFGIDCALYLYRKGSMGWDELRVSLFKRPDLALEILKVELREGEWWRVAPQQLSDEQLEELYVFLRDTFGVSPDPFHSNPEPKWSGQHEIVSILQKRPTPSALQCLEHLQVKYSDDWTLRRAFSQAQGLFLEALWEPISPVVIKRIMADRRQLLVRDGEELAEAVWSGLSDVQALMRAEGGLVMRLWNEPAYTPKHEEAVSREIAAELQRLLELRGVTITTEPRIRDGQFVDIYVSAVTPNLQKRLASLVIEVKGCWHPELKNALETQLGERYLNDNLSPHGVYLVVWFLCSKWSSGDTKRQKTPFASREAMDIFLTDQANAFNSRVGTSIRAFVFDATIDGPPVKEKRAGAKRTKDASANRAVKKVIKTSAKNVAARKRFGAREK
jgi:hypothetical protein